MVDAPSYPLDDLHQGLINADKAGDSASAQQFADEIRRMQAASPPAPGLSSPQVPPSSAGTPPRPVGALPAGASAAGTPAGNNQPTLPTNPSTGDIAFDPSSGPTASGIGQTIGDIVRYTSNMGIGASDYAASHLPTWAGGSGRTPAEETKLTDEAGNRLGWGKYAAGAAGYYANPISDISALGTGMGIVGRSGMRGVEGALAGGTESYTRGDSWPDVGWGALKGAGMNMGIGGALEPVSKLIGNVKANLPTSEQWHDAADQIWNMSAKSRFDQSDLLAASRDAQYGSANTGRPYTKAVTKLTDDITKSAQPGGVPVKDVLNFQNRANDLKGNDAQYGDMISRNIENMVQAHPAAPLINQARVADSLASKFDEISANPPSGYGQWLANQVQGHAFRLGREAPFIGALTAAEGAHQMGYSGLAHTLLALATTVPAAGYGATKVGELLQNRARDAALHDLTGTTGTPRFDPSYQDSVRKLIYSGAQTATDK